jgi:receptor-type tyrosine-protein phosphatase gamma
MMEVARTSETSVNFYQTTWRNNPEDSHLHTRRRENMKSHGCVYNHCQEILYHEVNPGLLLLYRVGEDGDWGVNNAIETQSNVTNYQVSGLFPFTVYSFRVVAVNAMGRSRPSKESYYMVTLREGE